MSDEDLGETRGATSVGECGGVDIIDCRERVLAVEYCLVCEVCDGVEVCKGNAGSSVVGGG